MHGVSRVQPGEEHTVSSVEGQTHVVYFKQNVQVDSSIMTPLEMVFQYHEQTKHQFFRYARSAGHLDWANQPDPFRRFRGAPTYALPILRPDEEPRAPSYDDLYRPGTVPCHPMSLRTLSRFFECALAISAWKQAGDVRWALRSNPSSGNLHPTEGYALIPATVGLAGTTALYHYAPKEHALELRLECPAEPATRLWEVLPPQACLFGLSSIHWREAWKYGERAFRYCQHDAGHAIGSVRIAAATLGWKVVLLEGWADDIVARVLGLDRTADFLEAEREHPDCLALIWVDQGTGANRPNCPDTELLRELITGKWYGQANRLSRDNPIPWTLIDEVAAASEKMEGWGGESRVFNGTPHPRMSDPGRGVASEHGHVSAGQIIRQRRSAVSFDGRTSVTHEVFFRMLSRVMPHTELSFPNRPMPWDAIPWDPRIHLALFVHRVDGLSPGLYVLVRDGMKVDVLRGAMHPHFLWTTPQQCPPDLPLYLLEEGDAKRVAEQVSCHQAIAADGAFSLGMIAEYEETLVKYGPWFYRRLFWETGVIGQILYLEAEAAGVRATGIGCFFDDPVHQVFGLKDRAFQSLYHFTIGGPVDDPRLTTLPAYGS
jgi:SagB-type dehydrogenase family enzyme